MRRAAVAAALLLAACATPAQRITDRLEAAGVPGSQARCMGNRLAERLSLPEMVEVERIVRSTHGERLTVARLIDRVGNARPALVAKIVETGVVCAI